MIFSADHALNGKIVVNLLHVNMADAFIYKMPNNIDRKKGTHGIDENNQTYIRNHSGRYEAPTDWSIYVVYNKNNEAGKIILSSWVENFSQTDKELLKT